MQNYSRCEDYIKVDFKKLGERVWNDIGQLCALVNMVMNNLVP
jgi:hypothetical protein